MQEERRECGVVCVTVSESAGRGKRGGGGASQEGAKGLSSPATSETTETGRERDTDPCRKIPSKQIHVSTVYTCTRSAYNYFTGLQLTGGEY